MLSSGQPHINGLKNTSDEAKIDTFECSMEIKIIIWIILGLVYLFARRKKKPEAPAPSRRAGEAEQEYESPIPDRPQTFEELLREIQGTKQLKVPAPSTFDLPPAQQAREKEITTYNYEAPPEKRQIENTNYDYRDHDTIYEVYEDAKKMAFYRPSLEESVKLTDTIVRFDQLKGYKMETKHNHAADFFNELKDPKNFRKAFLLSEILKRKF